MARLNPTAAADPTSTWGSPSTVDLDKGAVGALVLWCPSRAVRCGSGMKPTVGPPRLRVEPSSVPSDRQSSAGRLTAR
jgi:hypothetical protein